MFKLAFTITAGLLFTTTFASADEYYVVRKPHTHECKIVTTRPTDTTWVQLGPMAFKTREEAESKQTVLCKEGED